MHGKPVNSRRESVGRQPFSSWFLLIVARQFPEGIRSSKWRQPHYPGFLAALHSALQCYEEEEETDFIIGVSIWRAHWQRDQWKRVLLPSEEVLTVRCKKTLDGRRVWRTYGPKQDELAQLASNELLVGRGSSMPHGAH